MVLMATRTTSEGAFAFHATYVAIYWLLLLRSRAKDTKIQRLDFSGMIQLVWIRHNEIFTSLAVMTWFVAPPASQSLSVYSLIDRRYSELQTTIKWWCFDRWVNFHFLDFCWNVSICHVANRLHWFYIYHDQ